MNLTNKQIAKDLRNIANNYPEHSNKLMTKVYRNNTFEIRCIPSKSAILKVAKKYNKFLNWWISPVQKFESRMGKGLFKKKLFREMVIDGEDSNAVNYAVSFKLSIYFAKLENNQSSIIIDSDEFESGFVVGRIIVKDKIQNWNVTHLKSGFTCNSESYYKKHSINKFKLISKDDIKKKTSKFKGDYQQKSLLHYGVF